MRRVAILSVLAVGVILLAVPAAMAQEKEHFEVGAFADYVRLHNANDANFWGLGGRVGFGLAPHATIEAEMAYDFEKTFSIGTTTTTTSVGLRLWHGTFGPKIFIGKKNAQVFFFAKGGFLNFNTSNKFSTTVTSFTTGDTNGVFYPGGGFKVGAGIFGFRLDVGDLMYFDNGANHNLSIKFGPEIQF